MTDQTPLVAIGYSILNSKVKLMFQFLNVEFGDSFMKGLNLPSFNATLLEEGRSHLKECDNNESYDIFLHRVSPEGADKIIFINLFCGQSLKQAIVQLKAIKRILDITEQERALAYLCWLITRDIDYWLNKSV